MKYIVKLIGNCMGFCDTNTFNVLPYFVITILDEEDRKVLLDKTGERIHRIVEIGWLLFSIQLHF